jgi:hypothetical protein
LQASLDPTTCQRYGFENLSAPRRFGGFTPLHLLVLVAVAELSVTRLASEKLRPAKGVAGPTWFEVLDYAGLFLRYLGTALAVVVLAVKVVELLRPRAQDGAFPGLSRIWLAALLGLVAALAVAALVINPRMPLSFAFQSAWAAAILTMVVIALVRRHDLGAAIGIAVLAIPLLAHYAAHFVGYVLLTKEEVYDLELDKRADDWGLDLMVLSALVTPYCFAPRPIARSITRLPPIVVAMLLGGLAAVIVRRDYIDAMRLGELFVGVDLMPGVSQNDLALYLLALATLAWTLTSCTIADGESRRDVGLGVGLVVLGGYGFGWSLHLLLSVIGLGVILEAAPRLRDDEAPRGLRPRTPPIDDDAWQAWIAQLADALRKDQPGELKTVTVRGDDDAATTLLVGDRHGAPYKVRFGRLGGALVSIDVVCGREVAETTRATFTLYARPELSREPHPEPPPAGPPVHLDDAGFDARFRIRGDAAVVGALIDEPLRARATALLDGWVAWWHGVSLRYRVYPAIGAPLDHPVPVSDLAVRGAGTIERMAGTIEVLTSIAARGLQSPPGGEAQPAVLDGPPGGQR